MRIETEVFNLGAFAMVGFATLFVVSALLWVSISEKGWRKSVKEMIFSAFFILIVIAIPAIDFRNTQRNRQTPFQSEVVGVYSHATYHSTGGLGSRPQTVIHFTDGRTYVLNGNYNVIFSKGNVIEIEKNKGLIKITLLP